MTRKKMRRPESYRTISREIGGQIIELHKRRPRLGHDGLLKLPADAGAAVDPDELTTFLDHHNIHGEKWELAWGHIPGRFTPWPGLFGLGNCF